MRICTNDEAIRQPIVNRSCILLVALSLLMPVVGGCDFRDIGTYFIDVEDEVFPDTAPDVQVSVPDFPGEGDEPLGPITFEEPSNQETVDIDDIENLEPTPDSVVEVPKGNATQHSVTGGETAVPDPSQDIVSCGTARKTLDISTARELFGGLDECPQDLGLTLCPEFKAASPIGEYLFVFIEFDGPIDLESEEQFCEYAVVFDSDGDSSNNFRADAEFENDFFDNTDRRYKVAYSPDEGWTFEVTNATNTSEGRIASGARMIFRDNGVMLVVPAVELPSNAPSYRVTSFCHDGGFGLDGAPWSGDLYPVVGEPLKSFD